MDKGISVVLSGPCFEGNHTGCSLRGCGCTECHRQECERCQTPTASRYNVSMTIGEPYLVCPICVTELRDAVSSPVCDECGNAEAYRDIATASIYLCIGCYGVKVQGAIPSMRTGTDN
jgi:hypothetical protein